MSNIERKYAYYDEGVLPEEGEYGVTYLTLYSSSAGNIYDGWIYDPDNKIPVSVTERTFGYRHPEFSQYCWDDEVVVDLSNAQSRQESSEFAQGRLWSFNTNVSPYPIVLEDIDITGLTEEEREAKATTVLFSAIPLVDDSYIQAQIEVQCKCNLSPNNTSGEMRIEAFYIINDESDRSMRPNPVHTFTVSSANERHTLPWVYANPALKHDVPNYIGVKLICTGGTAEIGISDAHEYGDAIITLVSAGLTGDKIDAGKPRRLWIEGETLVPIGYELDISDYDVFCEYDTGEVYLVTHFCTFSPEPGTELINVTILEAQYMDLHATLRIAVAPVERIELTGLDYFFSSLKLDISDYTVTGYLTNGDIWDVTDLCTFSPNMGTTINQTTNLIASFENPNGAIVTDTLTIEKDTALVTGSNRENGLVYTLYDHESTIEITGNAYFEEYDPVIGRICHYHEGVHIPYDIYEYMKQNSIGPFVLKWNAEGPISGFSLDGTEEPAQESSQYQWYQCYRCEGFDDVQLVKGSPDIDYSGIFIKINYQKYLTSENLKFLNNVDDSVVYSHLSGTQPNITYELELVFLGCSRLTNLDFVSNWNTSGVTNLQNAFMDCKNLIDIRGLLNWDTSVVTNMRYMFYRCDELENLSGLQNWNVRSVTEIDHAFAECPKLSNIDALWFWRPTQLTRVDRLFYRDESLESISALTNWDKRNWHYATLFINGSGVKNLKGLENFKLDNIVHDYYYDVGSGNLESLDGSEDWAFPEGVMVRFINEQHLTDIKAAASWDISKVERLYSVFAGCSELEDISPLENWDVSDVKYINELFARTKISDITALAGWNVSNVITMNSVFEGCSELSNIYPLANWDVSNVESMASLFAFDDKIRYVGCLSGWNVYNVKHQDTPYRRGFDSMFARYDTDHHESTHIIDADSLSAWNVDRTKLSGASGTFLGTDVPANNRYLHNKLYPLPDWYIDIMGYQP